MCPFLRPITRHHKYTRMEVPNKLGDKCTRVLPIFSRRNSVIGHQSCLFLRTITRHSEYTRMEVPKSLGEKCTRVLSIFVIEIV